MLQSISLKCPGCGSNLEITTDMDRFACGYCGASQLVERRGGTVSLRLVTDAIKLVQAGTDKTAAELALKRLSGDLQNVEFEFRQLQYQLAAALRANQKVFTWLWIGAIVFCFFIGAGGSPASYVALVLGVGGTVAVLYFLNQRN